MPSVSELMAQKAAIEKQIAEARREEKAGVIAQIKALMTAHDLTLADISSRSKGTSDRGPRTGSKVAPKYRNTATGDTWSGRGLQPKWLKAALTSGRKLSDFAI